MSLLPKNIDSSWDDFLTNEVLNELRIIENNIGNDYFPRKENVLRFLELDLNNINYVIVGMEPYPSSFEKDGIVIPEATGRSFEVASLMDKSWNYKFKQSSLRNILKTIYYNETGKIEKLETIREKIKNNDFVISNPTDWFNNIEKQGVLFLNATLTVKAYTVDSHRKIWENFMKLLIKYIIENKNPVFVLWGKPAQDRFLPLVNKSICCCHPRLNDFIYENCFRQMNDIKWRC